MFALRTDQNGKVGLVEQKEMSFPARDNIGKFKQVVEWAEKMDPPIDLQGDYPTEAVLFFDHQTLADFCTFWGVMLHTTGTTFTAGERVTVAGRRWVSLRRAVAVRPEDEGPQNPSGVTSGITGMWVPEPLLASMSDVLVGDNDKDPLWCVSTHSVMRAFVYLDVSGFSKYPPGQEALIINTLVRLATSLRGWSLPDAVTARESMEAQLCIGDGYIYVFPDPLKATLFASWMAELIQQMVARRNRMGLTGLPVAFHFRIGVHYGAVYRFWDPGRERWNYIGDGINGGNRVLSVIDKKYDDILFVSDAVVHEFIARGPHTSIYANVRNCLENRGRQEDKHGKPWRVYLLNHTKLCEQPVQESLG
jgi:class 3 adenylate cyclase